MKVWVGRGYIDGGVYVVGVYRNPPTVEELKRDAEDLYPDEPLFDFYVSKDYEFKEN